MNEPTADRDPFEVVAASFLARYRAGQRPSIEEYAARYPELAEQIRALLPALVMVEEDLSIDRGSRADRESTLTQPRHVLETLDRSIGSVPRVMLPDTDPEQSDLTTTMPTSDAMPAPVEHGGRYQLFGEIARGGMGAVLRGRDPDLGRDLAVKVLLASHEDKPEMLRRFVEEAQIGGQLQHPGIVPVYELGAFADRRPYFTMKLVQGRTLSSLLGERQSPAHDLPRFLSIFESICQTVAYSHARGVIHRDLKPSNVMVGSFGEVQVMDWGLAKVLKEGGVADESPTKRAVQEGAVATVRSGSDVDESKAGSVLGTPAYMAPEQASGELGRVDRRADVFGLGANLCEILTGQTAYTGRSVQELYGKAMRGDTAEALARLDGCGAEAELIGLAKDCLAVEPEDRPRDAKVVAERITAYLAGVQERVRAAERERAVAIAKAIEERRRRKVQLALAASVLALMTLGGLSTTYYLQQRAEWAAAGQRLVDHVTTLRGQALAHPEEIPRWEVALTAVEQADSAGDPKTTAQLAALKTEIQDGLESAKRDKALLDRLVEIRSAEADDEDGSITDHDYAETFREAGIDLAKLSPAEAGAKIKARNASVVMPLAAALDDWAAIRRGKRKDAARAAQLSAVACVADPDRWRIDLRNALDQPAKASRRTSLQDLEKKANFDELGPISLHLLGTGLIAASDRGSDDSMALAQSVLLRAQRRYPKDVWVNHALGDMLEQRGLLSEAIRFFTAARAFRPETAHQLAHCLADRGNGREAGSSSSTPTSEADQKRLALARNADFDEAVAVFRDLTELRPGNALHFNCLGRTFRDKGRTKEATEVFEAAVVAGREAVRLKPDSASTHANLATALLLRGNYVTIGEDAIAELQTVKRLEPNRYFGWPFSMALDFAEDFWDDGHSLEAAIAISLHQRAHQLEASKPREAEPLFREALDGFRKIKGPDGASSLDLMSDLVRLLDRAGRSAEGELLFREVLERARKRFGPADPHTLRIIHKLGHALEASRPGEAEPLFRQALDGFRTTEGPDGAMTLDLTMDLANLLDRTGRSALAESLCRDALEGGRKRFGPADPRTAGIMATFGLSLIQQGKSSAAEPILRECLAIRERRQPEEWSTFHTRSLLGGCLLGQKQYAEAEPLILSGYEGMKAREAGIPPPGKPRLIEAADRVVKLYEAWDKKDKAAQWRAKIEHLAGAQVAYDQKRFVVATRLWAGELANDPKLGDNRETQHRYKAARAAALAAAGQGEDTAELDDAAKAKLRRQALDWLKAELAAWNKVLESDALRDRPNVGAKLSDWQKDTALASIRDAAALTKLPVDEQKRWQALWADVDSLRAAPLVHAAELAHQLVESKDPNLVFLSISELSRRIENGGADGEAVARLLLSHRQEIAPEPNVQKLLDELVSVEKSALAARLLLKVALAKSQVGLHQRGHVAVGRVVVSDAKLDPELVLAQMEILPEGYFAGAVDDLERPLGFRGEGYSSLEVPLKGKTGKLFYLGTVTLPRLATGQAASLQGNVRLDDAKPAHTTTVQLRLKVPPSNTPGNGYSSRRRWPIPITVAVSKAGEFKATRLSPTDYSLSITAPGYVGQERAFRLNPGETHEEGTITLERPRQIAVSYRVATRPPFTKAGPERQTVLGGGRFRANWQDSPEYFHDMEFPQNNGKISFRVTYGNGSIADLGPGKVEDFLAVDPTSAKFPRAENVVPQSGHVYLLDHQNSGNHWVLFQLEFDEKAPRVPGRP